jgi:hypothetical protein
MRFFKTHGKGSGKIKLVMVRKGGNGRLVCRAAEKATHDKGSLPWIKKYDAWQTPGRTAKFGFPVVWDSAGMVRN